MSRLIQYLEIDDESKMIAAKVRPWLNDTATLYMSIPHNLLKSRISSLVHNTFKKKDGSVRYTHIKGTRSKGYFNNDSNCCRDNIYTAK